MCQIFCGIPALYGGLGLYSKSNINASVYFLPNKSSIIANDISIPPETPAEVQYFQSFT